MNINIPEDVLMYDPFCIALVYDVSANEVQKIFHNYVKKYGNMLSRKEIYDLVNSYVSLHKEDMGKLNF